MAVRIVRAGLGSIMLLASALCQAQLPNRTQPGTLPAKDSDQRDRAVPSFTKPSPRLTVREKFRYRLRHSFDPYEFLRMNVAAAFDQWRQYPDEWGQGWDAYSVRLASVFGQHLVKEQIMFGVEALDHEDPRRPRSSKPTLRGRLLDAIKYTYVARNDNGRLMPAYSRFIGAYGAAFVSRQWYPREFHSPRYDLTSGTTTLAIDAGLNVLRELLHSFD